ncbi:MULTISPECIES: hypothetical protein [Bacillus]|uniref:hypothetical protein n=1 Tax=Bacillus TaxID=1386 RepID=UPI0018F30841|nr:MULTISPECIES: hypothetical protein [Bacillus]MBJ7951853.1 hypothetical protein [Bacillus cereus]MBX9155948.1 hypothetical protein [Bacillus cereus]MDZ4608438.1 hypothetical protein [Bacillus cereus]
MENPNKDKTCFIITPIGDDQSDIRRAADGVIDAVIIPSLIEMGFKDENIDVAHRMSNPGSINKQVITSVLDCDLAVANLTNLNPNVMYELAIRHAVRKPVIQICQKGTRLPFDITEERTIFYTNDMAGVIELNTTFKGMVTQAIDDEEPDNPIYRVIEGNTIMKSIDISDPSRYLLEHLNKLEDQLSDLTTSLKPNKYKQGYARNVNMQNDGIRKQTFSFTMDISKISPRQLEEEIRKFIIENPDVSFKARYLGDEAIISIYSSNTLAIDGTVQYILNQDGVTFGSSANAEMV